MFSATTTPVIIDEVLDVIEPLTAFPREGGRGFRIGDRDLKSGDFAPGIESDVRGVAEVAQHDFEDFPGGGGGVHGG